MSPDVGIMGVRSSSEKTPFKIAGFDVENSPFVGQTNYSHWHFIYNPRPSVEAQPSVPKIKKSLLVE